jgi:hypothetical protein
MAVLLVMNGVFLGMMAIDMAFDLVPLRRRSLAPACPPRPQSVLTYAPRSGRPEPRARRRRARPGVLLGAPRRLRS